MSNDPTAQGTQAEASGSGDQSNVEQKQVITPDPMSGIQKRVDQLVGQFHEAQRENAELRGFISQLQADRNAPRQEAPPEIDADDAKKISYIVREATAPLQRQIAELSSAIAQTRVGGEMTQVQAQLQKIKNPLVSERVNELLTLWKRNGGLASGAYTPMDAVRVAAGEFALGMIGDQSANLAERTAFNGAGGPPLAASGGNAGARKTQSAPVTASTVPSTKEIGEMSVEELGQFIKQEEAKNPGGLSLSE